ncbi:3-oxoacyl-[acyl-carrier-protein] synthase, KASII [Thioalkalivibrio nitratireducens DSM 14787]|uniref:Beta-ketoacyl-ACP synthase II n=1 Tax=Thioalkalivibrio nitratireducens (strain DSM 14787 / UNIQEM 213 / ALEN2) TaxID=1255043 RepID=L0DUH5_THIND|nr:3-oxoacyl-[acyl-carrier-protein] synthase, KASII [Thioalkalivibrio nitratireducens DSM 14787]
MGSTVETAWANIVAGKSGITPIDVFDASEMPVRISGAVRDFNADDYVPTKDQKKMDTFVLYGLAAGLQALEDSGLDVTDANADRIGVAIGSGIGGLPYIERSYGAYLKGGARKISPFFVPSAIINMVAGNLSIMRGLKGPNISIVSACATGTHNIGDAARMIAYGDVDAMLAGGAEMATTPLGIGGFAAARALSTRNDDPARASRPWDRDRDGFVLSDGAGVLMLEEYEHARARGARIYCELAGFAWNSDAYHMTQPSQGGEGAADCMLKALQDAGMNADEVGYINAHGTSTPAGDLAETLAVKRALGDHAQRVLVNSTKSMTGHLLGAAGGIEALFCALALHQKVSPPTINLDHPGEGCDLDYVAHEARDMDARVALSNSFGFGGTNGTLVFRTL